jgi:hypothetical protein
MLRIVQATKWVRTAILLVFIGALWSASPADAWAWQRKKKEEPAAAAGKSYVFPYAIVMMGIMAGMMAVCRPGRRADEPPRPEK